MRILIRPMHKNDIKTIYTTQGELFPGEEYYESYEVFMNKFLIEPLGCWIAETCTEGEDNDRFDYEPTDNLELNVKRHLGHLFSHIWLRDQFPPLNNAKTLKDGVERIRIDQSNLHQRVVYLNELAVRKQGRGYNIGRVLVQKMFENSSLPEFQLVSVQNSYRFWESIGFKIVDTLPQSKFEYLEKCYGKGNNNNNGTNNIVATTPTISTTTNNSSTSITTTTMTNNSNSSNNNNSLLMTLKPKNDEAQQEEIACLQSIYSDDFELLPSDAVCRRFKVTLIPHPTGQYQNYCSVKLVVKYTPNYPETLPIIELEKVKGLSDDQIDELYILLSQKMVPGDIIVFELCQGVQEFLLMYNKETVSLYDEMIQRIKDGGIGIGDSHQITNEKILDNKMEMIGNSGGGNGGMMMMGQGLSSLLSSSSGQYMDGGDYQFHNYHPPSRINNSGGFTSSNSPFYMTTTTTNQSSGADGMMGSRGMGSPITRVYSNENFEMLVGGLDIADSIFGENLPRGSTSLKAINLGNNQQMICKAITLDSDKSDSDSSNNNSRENMLKVFAVQKEIECLKHLNNPHLVKYIGTAIEGYTLYIFQDYVKGESLKRVIEKTPGGVGLDETTVRKYTYQLLLALLYLHSQHIPHRDLKSKNIFIDENNRVLITNYGGKNMKIFDHHFEKGNPKNFNFWISQKSLTNSKNLRRDDLLNLGLVVLEMTSGYIFNNSQQIYNNFLKNPQQQPNEYMKLMESKLPPDAVSHLARDFLSLCFSTNDPNVKLEAGLLLKHPFISSHFSLNSAANASNLLPPQPVAIPPTAQQSKPQPQVLTQSSSSSEISQPHLINSLRNTNSSISTSTSSNNTPPSSPVQQRVVSPKTTTTTTTTTATTTTKTTTKPNTPAANKTMTGSGSSSILDQNDFRYSRYRTDFEEIELIGKGGFGIVVKSRNKLDGRYYAVKKIKTEGYSDAADAEPLTNKLLREVTTLSRLHHQYVVRYYQAWIEKSDYQSQYDDDDDGEMEDLSGDLETDASEDWFLQSSRSILSTSQIQQHQLDDYFSTSAASASTSSAVPVVGGVAPVPAANPTGATGGRSSHRRILSRSSLAGSETPGLKKRTKNEPKKDTHTLYIQMDYCSKKTLKTLIDNVGGMTTSSSLGSGKNPNETENSNNNNSINNNQQQQQHQQIQLNENEENQSMTGGVGTPFYCCPEILQKNTKHYGVKVDMYSLGIIFFEMCHPFQTQMERSNTLRELRNDLKFPPGFEALKPDQASIIKSLLSKDPNNRPTTQELLDSDLLPSRMEDDILKEAIKTIANPTISLFNYLMEKLFGLSSDEHIISRYLYTANVVLSPPHLMCREKTYTRISNIFKNHGALRIDTPIFFPKDSSMSNSSVIAKFIDEGGTVVHLPYDLTVPWARHIAIHGISQSKRYSFSKVFRRATPGFSPKELCECDFDIVGPLKSRHVNDAEILRTVVDIMEEFSKELGPNSYVVRVNHYAILDGVLGVCGVDKKDYGQVYMAISQLHWKWSWNQVVSSLREIGLSNVIIHKLAVYLKQKGELGANGISQLESLLANRKDATPGITDLKALCRNLQNINIIQKFYLDLSLVHNYHYYDGIVFQAVVERTHADPGMPKTEIIMAGGRYDKLIHSFLPSNPTASQANICGIGVTIATEKIVNSVLIYQQRMTKSKGIKFPSDIEVFVCSLGSPMLSEKLQVCSQLWSMNIRADYSQTDYTSVEEIHTHCKQNGIPWAVVLKDRAYQTGSIKVRHVETRNETSLARKDLVDYILKAKKYRVMESVTTVNSGGSVSISNSSIGSSGSSTGNINSSSSSNAINTTGSSGNTINNSGGSSSSISNSGGGNDNINYHPIDPLSNEFQIQLIVQSLNDDLKPKLKKLEMNIKDSIR
eukprot:gene3965-4959_t